MKRVALIIISMLLIISAVACTAQTNTPNNDTAPAANEGEQRRIDLYVAVMKAAFNEENGGKQFIAVKLDTLAELSDKAKDEVLKELAVLSQNVYDFEKIKNDGTKFELDNNGTLLSIELERYSKSKATITGVSWFGNLGAVFPTYEATYKNGKWELKLIRMAIS
ncbi:MAG: hypothetical protein K0R80_1508 [Clostridia bacterium]|jgi:hypothetical protein|nr:hypothetical protein [Clostridia bacterium]